MIDRGVELFFQTGPGFLLLRIDQRVVPVPNIDFPLGQDFLRVGEVFLPRRIFILFLLFDVEPSEGLDPEEEPPAVFRPDQPVLLGNPPSGEHGLRLDGFAQPSRPRFPDPERPRARPVLIVQGGGRKSQAVFLLGPGQIGVSNAGFLDHGLLRSPLPAQEPRVEPVVPRLRAEPIIGQEPAGFVESEGQRLRDADFAARSELPQDQRPAFFFFRFLVGFRPAFSGLRLVRQKKIRQPRGIPGKGEAVDIFNVDGISVRRPDQGHSRPGLVLPPLLEGQGFRLDAESDPPGVPGENRLGASVDLERRFPFHAPHDPFTVSPVGLRRIGRPSAIGRNDRVRDLAELHDLNEGHLSFLRSGRGEDVRQTQETRGQAHSSQNRRPSSHHDLSLSLWRVRMTGFITQGPSSRQILPRIDDHPAFFRPLPFVFDLHLLLPG